MRHLVSSRIPYAVLTTALWIAFFAWAAWLNMAEARYKSDYFGHVARRGGLLEYQLGTAISSNEKGKALFFGWSPPEPGFRWSNGKQAAIGIRLAEAPDRGTAYRLRMTLMYTIGTQRMTVSVNGAALVSTSVAGPGVVTIPVPGSLLTKGVNRFVFELPDAISPGRRDLRELGIALKDFTVEAVPPS